ncbi:MAG TPA: LTA synthase family protein [Hanamia sp.]|nr:LTA synthase family protein [Hanamia sp.]
MLLIGVYEIVINHKLQNANIPLFTIAGTTLINYVFYSLKIYLFLLIPYLLFYFLSKKIASFVYILFAIFLLLVQLGLVQYFNKTMVPLGSDLYAYSLSDIRQTIGASGSIHLSTFIFALLLIAVFVFIFIYFPKKIIAGKFLTATIIAFSIIIVTMGFTLSPSASLKTEFARTVVINKSDFFITQSCQYFFPEKVEDDIYSDTYSGDFGDNSVASIKDFVYVDDSKFPFLHKDETPDVLSPFFNKADHLPNIVIILVEGLGRAFTNDGAVLGNFTPYLDSLSKESLYWKNFLSSGGRSFAVLPSVLGSLPFAKNGFNELGDRMPEHLSLLSLARHNGYKTAFFYGGDSRFDNMNLYMKKDAANNIYDEFTFPSGYTKLPSHNGFTWGYGDNELFRRYLELLPQNNNNQPQLNVLFTVATHSPFLLGNQEKYNRLFEERMNQLGFSTEKKAAYEQYKAQYASILFLDEAIKNFIENYKQRSEFKNTIFIITGDHRMPEIPMISKMDRYHVPLIIYSPLLKRTATFSSISSHFDIAPSLLAFLNNSYSFEKPTLASWIGSGLDTTRSFSNIHQYPLMQTKNEVIDFVQGTSHLNGENTFSLEANMDEEPMSDKIKMLQLQHAFDLFKSRNQKFIDGAKLIPDSIYIKYFPH